MPEFLFADRVQGSAAILMIALVVLGSAAFLVALYFTGKRTWRANGPRHPRAIPPAAGSDAGTLTIIRGWNPIGGRSSFRVIMDDHEIALLVPGRTRTARVAAGPHQLHVETQGRPVSEPLEIDVQPGEEIRLQCAPGRPRRRLEGAPATWVRLVRQ